MKKGTQVFLFLIVISGLIKTNNLLATTYTFYPTEDTYIDGTITGPNNFNKNFGRNTNLRIQTTTNVLVKFSQNQLLSTLGSSHIVAAYLELYEERIQEATLLHLLQTV